MKTVFVCKESFEGIMCGIYDAWMSRLGHENVSLVLENCGNMELFCDYREVPESKEKASNVIASIRTKISQEAYKSVYKASLSQEEDRADKIYRFLIYGFHYGSPIIDMLQIPAVCDIFEICRNVGNEQHYLLEFIRFSEMEQGVLVSRVGPKNDVIVLVAPHFADRLSGENWIIYDEKRKKAILHPKNGCWVVMKPESEEWEARLDQAVSEDDYQNLWNVFRNSVAIAERINPVCQRTHMPLRYRPYMPEFKYGVTEDINRAADIAKTGKLW